ncbi:hypothetical protein EG329_005142 [Mollisiaceae sp. DMI_Dod_QoI]|nr:hypothetical protein EG329_005142 [Helotiales sp. DMI_Dod_QoI]
MADRNSYLAYKRDTRYLLYWMIHASNTIINSSSSLPILDGVSTSVNTTGQIPVSAIVPTSTLIAKHISPIPSTIYRLFQSVIAARTATHSVFQQIVAQQPDPEIERSNVTHRHFIDAFTRAFEVLGGKSWISEQQSETIRSDEEDSDDVIFANKFSNLNTGEASDDEEEEDADDADGHSKPAQPARQTKPRGKKKKGKKGKKGKGKSKTPVKQASLEDVPLESYRIIEDGDGLVTDYLMAVYSLATQWIELRSYMQGIWREVAYGGLNSAAAGTMSNIAIAMVKKTEAAIFVEFPGHDSYETVMNTITRGDPERQGRFHMSLLRVGPNGEPPEQVHETDVDAKEQIMIHGYRDLLDFVLDFQKTRSGKPTKPMMAEIRDWDPRFNLQRATKEQRIKWRRSYTINWLYDLVNLFSSIVVQRNTMKGQKWVLENVDWSVNGPWNVHRRLFGLNEFAGVITTLAMQKPGTDVRSRIPPSCVFQLQCIVDSLMVSRGWSISSLQGHILIPPAPGFRSRRDVDLFLDRNNERIGHGYCHAVDILKQFFEKDAMLHGDFNRHEKMATLLKELQQDFVDFLGESIYMSGLKTIPPSRFSNSDSNGLQEYSPFLCGVGLMEALELAYGLNLVVWDGIPEPFCLIHLHNMLVAKGYIDQPIGLFSSLQDLFPTAFFAEGKAPTSDFTGALLAVINPSSRRLVYDRRAVRRALARTATDIHGLLDPSANRFYKQKSFIRLYRDADWNHERIPDEQLPPTSSLGSLRIGQTKEVTDAATGKKVLERTFLVNQALAQGVDDETLMKVKSMLQERNSNTDVDGIPEALLPPLPEGYRRGRPLEFGRSNAGTKPISSDRDLLSILKMDIVSDIASARPLSSLNYVWVTVRFMMLFMQIEDRLKELRNPLWVRAYDEDSTMMREKRASLTVLALAGDDEECLQVMAEEFENPRSGFMQHIYWEDLDDHGGMKSKDPLEHLPDVGCSIM